MIKHSLTHYYQPTNNSCSQGALAMLLSHYNVMVTPDELINRIPVNLDPNGEPWGTVNQQLAKYCINLGFSVSMVSADFQILDLAWINKEGSEIIERLESAKVFREIPSLGKDWSEIYAQSYIDYMHSGGKLNIVSHMTTPIIDSELEQGPLLASVCYSVLHNSGRSIDTGLRESKPDDIHGKIVNHSIVIHGKDSNSNYTIADPYKKPGHFTVEPERLLCAMTAAQIECDNLFFRIEK